ncbi:hypothetical protein [uncultured Gimesia sp.]|uniref:hypothetical protein n=1 Tax=uncultured Gimesia sp. TaxID=1678688 RepID=UPI0026187F1A|nr:hypothetical protein [uncultured Gimesia sp.]
MANLRCMAPWMVCGIAVILLSSACETLPEWGSNGMSIPHEAKKVKSNPAESYRTRFQTNRDPKALDWILTNRLYSGMSRSSVEKEIGEEGEFQEASKWLKATGGTFRTSDTAYKWGPDASGRSVYLIFREGILVNFNPEDFELGES